MSGLFANSRSFVGELMDSPRIAAEEHLEALAGLRRINEVSGVYNQIARPILEMARAARLERISLLDIACGGGDVPISVAQELRRQGIEIHLALLDRSATALSHAESAAKRAGISCQIIGGDASEIGNMQCVDVVTNSLFLHHLAEGIQVVDLLRSMRKVAGRIVVISDLRRSRFGWAAAWAGCRVLSRSRIVHNDGPVSVRAAWTMDELRQFAGQAGMEGVVVQKSKPWRMLLVWKRATENDPV